MTSVSVIKVKSNKELNKFIKIPWRIYKNDPNWVPPLFIERKLHLAKSNPYFHHAKAWLWIAYKDGEPVGRISAQIDRLYEERHDSKTGHWGLLEAIDSPDVFRALFNSVEKQLKKEGKERMLGPFNLSINQECGMLIKGFEYPPFFMMPHNPTYYPKRLHELGHTKAKDLIAYSIEKNKATIDRIQTILGRRLGSLATRPINKKELERELDSIFYIFNNAWSQNWGFVPFTRDEYIQMGKSMNLIASPNLIRISEIDGKPVGFIALLPNLNEIIKDMDGRLFPINWLKLLWRLKFHDFKSGRVLLMGVLKEYQNSLIGAAISLSLIRDVMKEILETPMTQMELSWILEDNLAMRRIIEGLGAKPYKTYRIYEKALRP